MHNIVSVFYRDRGGEISIIDRHAALHTLAGAIVHTFASESDIALRLYLPYTYVKLDKDVGEFAINSSEKHKFDAEVELDSAYGLDAKIVAETALADKLYEDIKSIPAFIWPETDYNFCRHCVALAVGEL